MSISHLPNDDLATLLRAVKFASHKHSTQRRKDAEGSPYINHPIRVAETLASVGGVTDIDILAAAVLHDTLEDTETTPEELEREFGPRVRKYVEECTDDKSLPKMVRKALQIVNAPSKSEAARMIKQGDKEDNSASLEEDAPKNWTPFEILEYLYWAELVIIASSGVNTQLEKHALSTIKRVRAKYKSPA